MGSVKTSSHNARSGNRAKSLPMDKKLVSSNSLVHCTDGTTLWCSLMIRAMVDLASVARSGHPERVALPAMSPEANEQHEGWVHSWQSVWGRSWNMVDIDGAMIILLSTKFDAYVRQSFVANLLFIEFAFACIRHVIMTIMG